MGGYLSYFYTLSLFHPSINIDYMYTSWLGKPVFFSLCQNQDEDGVPLNKTKRHGTVQDLQNQTTALFENILVVLLGC